MYIYVYICNIYNIYNIYYIYIYIYMYVLYVSFNSSKRGFLVKRQVFPTSFDLQLLFCI